MHPLIAVAAVLRLQSKNSIRPSAMTVLISFPGVSAAKLYIPDKRESNVEVWKCIQLPLGLCLHLHRWLPQGFDQKVSSKLRRTLALCGVKRRGQTVRWSVDRLCWYFLHFPCSDWNYWFQWKGKFSPKELFLCNSSLFNIVLFNSSSPHHARVRAHTHTTAAAAASSHLD